METSLTVNFKDVEKEEGLRDLLIIEQEEWVNTTGQIKKSQFYNFTYNLLASNLLTNTTECGLNADGSCTSVIYVYPRVPDLEYDLKTSFGELKGPSNDEYKHQEIIKFEIANKADLTYSPKGSVTKEWLGSVYDKEGNVTSAPTITIDDLGNIKLSAKVFGTLKVEYAAPRDKYLLTVHPREEGSDLFGAVVYGVYEKGISWLELKNPPDLDELSEGSAACGGMSVYDDDEDEDDGTDGDKDPLVAPKVYREIVYDYCSRIVQSDTITYV